MDLRVKRWTDRGRAALRPAALIVATTLLVACGGGGSGGSSGDAGFRAPPPNLVEDILPTSARIDRRADNFFPLGDRDRWIYDQSRGGQTVPAAATREVINGPDSAGNLVLREFIDNDFDDTPYRVTSDGLLLIDALGVDTPAGARRLVGDIIEYPQPFYAQGETRRSIRQGTWDEDLDRDGRPEGFRFELSQVFEGFEPVALPLGSATAARFTTTTSLTVTPSNPANAPVSFVATERAWFAPGIGLVRSERSATSNAPTSSFQPYTLSIRGGIVGGTPLFAPPVDGTVRVVPLTHAGVVHDRLRDRYYASIPAAVVGNGNRIATIERAGAVSYSDPIGDDPGPMALSADGTQLYVGLRGASQVVRIDVPAMTVSGSANLPTSAGGDPLFAESLSVSPTDPGALAVSLFQRGLSPRHAGVVLLRNLAVQPVRTQSHTGSNLVAFSPSGTEVYGLNVETTERGLRRLSVASDGLTEQLSVPTDAVGALALDVTGSRVLAGNQVFGVPQLGFLGSIASSGGACRLHPGGQVLCADPAPNVPDLRLAVADATSLAVTRRLTVPGLPATFGVELVPGAAGQVAIREGVFFFGAPPTRLLLFTSPAIN